MKNEDNTTLKFSELVDIQHLQTLLEFHFKVTNVPISILDTDHTRLVAAGLQDICMKFHRIHPVTHKRCQQSDDIIKSHLDEGRYIEYKCRNGLWDLAVPIMIAGKHMATLFIGQFFYKDEKPDIEFFRKQAEELGFNTEKYLEVLRQVPVFSREKVQGIIEYYSGFVELLSTMGYNNLLLARDIEKRKQVEEEIRTLNAELEQRVRARTAELEASNKELRDFVYVSSHDLKTPLRGISQLAQWLVHDYADAFDEQGQEMVELLINRVKRMDGLIDGILEYSRVGNTTGKDEEINLNRLVREVIDNLAPPEQIRILIENELPIIVGDKTRIAQIVQNLLSNAVEYMDKPEGKITIGCVDEGSHWTFSVADNGPGIDSKYHEKIFQIFQTLQSRDEHESTGIGLALVKKIVELYGGKIWVESTVGQGSIFCFTLPKR